MIKALLFDFDGTLLNTNDLIIQTFMHVLEQEFPGQYTAKDCERFIGPTLEETFTELAPQRCKELVAMYRDWNAANHDALVTQYDGVVEVLEQLHADGIRLAIVSSKSTAGIERGMRVLNIAHLFEVIVSADDVQQPKPHAEPILLALAQLGVAKDEVIMIGDNSHDLESARNAGVLAAGVAWSFKGETFLRAYKPQFMLQHMRDLHSIVEGLK